MRTPVLVLSVLLACGKNPEAPAAVGSASGSAPAVATATPAPPVVNSACNLLSRTEAEKLVGTELPEETRSVDAIGNQHCQYKKAKPYATVDVTLWSRGQTSLDENLALKYFGTPPVEITGVGTRALRNAAGNIFGVLANGKFASAFGVTMSPPMATAAATSEELAKLVAGRL